MSSVTRIKSRGPGFWTAASLLLVLVLGGLDYLAGPELAFSLVYALPVAAVAWFARFWRAAAVALVSDAVWLWVDLVQGVPATPLIVGVNGVRRLAILLAIGYVFAALRSRLDSETRSARTDFLTGIGNSRSFHEIAAAELDRAFRYGRPFTLVYADVDDFKDINDRLGHRQGDTVLKSIAGTMRQSLRSVDQVARIGGDEFGILLPETDLDAARAVLEKLQGVLNATPAADGRVVTITMGALVCKSQKSDVTELMSIADSLLLSGKRKGKNTIEYAVHDGSA